MRSNGAIDDAQHTAHDDGLAGKQKTQWERYAKHLLAHRLMRQNRVHQQRGAFSHAARSATGAKTTAFATERHQFLVVASLTANPQEAMLKSTALQVLIKFSANERGQVLAVARQFSLKLGPVLTDNLIEQGCLGPVANVRC